MLKSHSPKTNTNDDSNSKHTDGCSNDDPKKRNNNTNNKHNASYLSKML